MNNLKTIISTILFISFIIVIVYFKSQTTYYKSAYEAEVKKHNDYVSLQKDEYNKLTIKYKDITLKYNNKIIEAEKDAENKQKIIDNTVITNNNILSSLQQQIHNNQSNMPNYSSETIIHYTDTYSDLFFQCAGRLVEVAEAADGQVIDKTRLEESWPDPIKE